MTKADFFKWQFAGSLPTVIVARQDFALIPCGGLDPGFDISQVHIDGERVILRLMHFITPKWIHGLLHYDGPHQMFFMGYECGKCDRVFLVPDTVTSEADIHKAVRHSCMDPTR